SFADLRGSIGIVPQEPALFSGTVRDNIAYARADATDEAIAAAARAAQAMEQLLRGRSTLIIAHRLSTVLRADRLIVLDRGRIVEAGTHADLLLGEGVYAR